MRNIVGLLAIFAIAVIGCGENSLQPEIQISANTVDTLPQETGTFKIAVPIPKIVAVNVARVEYVITASDMSDLQGELTIGDDDVARGTARNVPAGGDRLVTLNAYNAEEVMSYSGSATTDVVAGETVSINIVMRSLRPTTGDIEINGTFESVGEPVVSLPGGVQMEFVWIEPGMFVMGSPNSEVGRSDDEGPQHEVTISQGFYLGKFEITQEQWESVMGTTPWFGGERNVQANPSHPAVDIPWNDMQEFIGRLDKAAGEEVYRLPG